MMQDQIGKILKSYEIEELIGTGGFGAVYRARQSVVGREVAIKIIWPAFANHPNFIRRFEAEAQLVAGLEHPYIVPLYDYWRDPEGAYIVMRWIRGGTLRDVLGVRQYSMADLNRFINQIGSALAMAHKYGVVHRDIKPENILLDEDHNAYLADFGIAQILSNSNDEDDFMGMGSPAYAAPEQISGGLVSSQSDLYSLGILIYEMLSGEHPFPQLAEFSMTELNEFRNSATLPSIKDVRPDLPTALDDILKKSTAINPSDRFDDVLSFIQVCQDIANNGRGTLFNMPRRSETEVVPNPYKGLRPFLETDAHNFFGREALVNRLVDRLKDDGDYTRFLSIVGPSGSGKSSLVKAGLIPTLRQGAMIGSGDWFYETFVPGTKPFEELQNALVSVATEEPQNLYERLTEDVNGLSDAVNEILPDDGSELFLFIDQFEEVFTLVDDDKLATHFLESLYYAVTNEQSRLRVVITIRADFYDRPLLQPLISNLVRERTEVVVPLSTIELERVIVEPARRVGVVIDNALVASISTEVRQQAAALPLLQYTLSELFESRDGLYISPKVYKELGGVHGALAKRADEIYNGMEGVEQELTRQLFLRLITLGEGTEDTRRRALLTEVTSLRQSKQRLLLNDIIERWGKARLITFDRDPVTRSPTIEVTHEAIIREWGILRAWLDDSRNDVRMQRSLSSLAQEWHDNSHDKSYLLRGIRLEQFEEWVNSTSLNLSQDEQHYLGASVLARRDLQQQEAERKEREEQLEVQAYRRLQLIVAFLLVAFVGAIALSGFAFSESNRAETALATSDANAKLSSSLALDASARQVLSERDGDLATVLSLLAHEQMENPPVQLISTLSEVAFSPGARDVLLGHSAFVQSVDINRDNTLIASGSTDATVKVWDFATGELLYILTGHGGDIESVQFSPDGQYLVSTAADFKAILWDMSNGELVHEFSEHSLPVTSVAFTSDGNYMVTGSSDLQLILWDVWQAQEIRRFMGHEASILTLAINADATRILSGARDGDLMYWDLNTGDLLATLTEHQTGINDVVFNSDGTQAYSVSGNGSIFEWDLATLTVNKRFVGNNNEVRSIALTPDQEFLYAVGIGGDIDIWDTASGLGVGQLSGHTDDIQSIALSQDGQVAVTGSKDTSVRVWNVGNPSVLDRLEAHTGRITGIYHTRNGRNVISASTDGILRWWQFAMRTIEREVDVQVPIFSFAINQSETRIALGSRNGLIVIIDVATGEEISRFNNGEDTIQSLTFGNDPNQLVIATQNGIIQLLNLSDNSVTQNFEAHTSSVYNLSMIPGQDQFVSVSRDGASYIWNIADGTIAHTLLQQSEAVYSSATSNDGRLIATGDGTGFVMLWDAETGAEITRLLGDLNTVWSLAFSPDDERIIAGAASGEVVVWDVESEGVLQRFILDDVPVFQIIFTADGRLSLSGMENGRMFLLRSYPYNLLIDWVQNNRYIRELTCVERTQYRVEPLCES